MEAENEAASKRRLPSHTQSMYQISTFYSKILSLERRYSITTYTPLKINMEHSDGGGWKIMFLSFHG